MMSKASIISLTTGLNSHVRHSNPIKVAPSRDYHHGLLTGEITMKHRHESLGAPIFLPIFEQKRGAARRGKRIERAREAAKRARERKKEPEVKLTFEQKLALAARKLRTGKIRHDDRHLDPEPEDDIFWRDTFREVRYPLVEAIQIHEETHRPSMYNDPEALIYARIEFDMRTKKKTRFVEKFSGTILFEHTFPYHQNKRICALAKKEEDQEAARNAGAVLAGGADIIQMIKKGSLLPDHDFDHLVCHPDIYVDLAEVRGILGSYFPNKTKGNIGGDIPALVHRFLTGLDYSVIKDDFEKDFAHILLPFGRLNQEKEHLVVNFEQLLNEVVQFKPALVPAEHYTFVTRVLLESPPSEESLPILFWEHCEELVDPRTVEEREDEDDESSDEEEIPPEGIRPISLG